MKVSEKLKRIKLISEKLFVEYQTAERFKEFNSGQISELSIKDAHIFMLTFELFEDKFLAEHQGAE